MKVFIHQNVFRYLNKSSTISILIVSLFLIITLPFIIFVTLNQTKTRSKAASASPDTSHIFTDNESTADTFVRYKDHQMFQVNLPLSQKEKNQILLSPNRNGDTPDVPITKKVLLLNFNPILENLGGVRLNTYKNWNDPYTMAQTYIQDVNMISGGYVNYQVTQQILIDDIPIKNDGFDYTDETYLACLSNAALCHTTDTANYIKLIADYHLCEKRNTGEIDEIWMFGGHYFGFWEGAMAGPNAFNINGGVYRVGTTCTSNVPIMGFNSALGVDMMLHDLGHRTEGTMRKVYGSFNPPVMSSWDLFSAPAIQHTPAGCGNTHFPANGVTAYDYGNQSTVSSTCDDWFNYPNLTGSTTEVNCNAWGCSHYGYQLWFFNHLPRIAQTAPDGKLNNWWKYIVDYEQAFIPPDCTESPLISLVSPTNGYVFPDQTNIVSFSATAVFNTCSNSRYRDIWIRDVTASGPWTMLCYYSYDTEDNTFYCGYTVQNNHQYEWLATAQNEAYSSASQIWNFTLGSPPSPTPCSLPETPTGLNFQCNNLGNQAIVSWQPSDASYYSLYLNNTADEWSGNCSSPNGDLCVNIPSTTFGFSVQPSQSYEWWLYGRNLCNDFGSRVDGQTISCYATSPTPTPSPTPLNLLLNNSFEIDADDDTIPDHWAKIGFIDVRDRQTSEYFRSGLFSYKIVGVTNKAKKLHQLVSGNWPAETTLYVSGWAKTVGLTTNGPVQIGLGINYTNNSQQNYVLNFPKGSSYDWTQRTGSITLALSANRLDSIVIYSKNNGSAYFDDISVSTQAPLGDKPIKLKPETDSLE